MRLGRILTWVGIAFLIFFIAFRPGESSTFFANIGHGIMAVAEGFGGFFDSLVA